MLFPWDVLTVCWHSQYYNWEIIYMHLIQPNILSFCQWYQLEKLLANLNTFYYVLYKINQLILNIYLEIPYLDDSPFMSVHAQSIRSHYHKFSLNWICLSFWDELKCNYLWKCSKKIQILSPSLKQIVSPLRIKLHSTAVMSTMFTSPLQTIYFYKTNAL